MSATSAICFLCGLPGADTREHVISRGWYPVGPRSPTNTFTLASHALCNKSTAKDEEYIGHLHTMCRPEGFGDDGLFNKALRALKRPESERYKTYYLGRMVDVANGASVEIDVPRLHNVLAKIVRAFTYREEGLVLPQESGWVIRKTDMATLTAAAGQVVHDDEVLLVKMMPYHMEPGASVWWLSFYGHKLYDVMAYPPALVDMMREELKEGAVVLPWPRSKA